MFKIAIKRVSGHGRKKGLEYKEKTLEIRKRVLGENHASTADSYNNVGYFYWLLGRQLVTLEYLKKFFDIEKLLLGAEAEVTIEAQKKLQYVQTHPVHDPNDEEERNT